MATTTRARGSGTAARPTTPKLPPVTVARFEEAGRLLERLVEEQADVFLAAGQRYRDRHADTTRRALTPEESGQVAAALVASMDDGASIVDLTAQVQASELRAIDQPSPQELLLAAGAATAPALVEATRRFVALVELDPDTFEEACEADDLDRALEQPARDLRALELPEARRRAAAALDHFAIAAGASSGPEAWALLTRTVGSAFQEAMKQLAPTLASDSSSLTGSPPPTDGNGASSSTTPPTGTP